MVSRVPTPELRARHGPGNATGRVLASNTPTMIVGSMIHPECGTRQELPPGEDWADCAGLPWFLVRG